MRQGLRPLQDWREVVDPARGRQHSCPRTVLRVDEYFLHPSSHSRSWPLRGLGHWEVVRDNLRGLTIVRGRYLTRVWKLVTVVQTLQSGRARPDALELPLATPEARLLILAFQLGRGAGATGSGHSRLSLANERPSTLCCVSVVSMIGKMAFQDVATVERLDSRQDDCGCSSHSGEFFAANDARKWFDIGVCLFISCPCSSNRKQCDD